MGGRREAIDEGAREIAEEVVDDLPATPTELNEELPDDIQSLIEDLPDDLRGESLNAINGEQSVSSLLSDTPLGEYLD